MLFKATLFVDLFAMAVSLWMAFYLFARGFPSRITLRAVIVLLALSTFFFSAYENLFHQIIGTAALRAIMLIIGLVSWYSLTYQLATARNRRQPRWPGIGIYVLGAVTALLLATNRDAFIGEQGNLLYVAHMGFGLPYILYGLFQFVACAGILYNLLKDTRIGLTSQGRFFLLASIFPTAGAVYGVLALAIAAPMPRLFQDLLVFSGVFLLGISVIFHQTFVERRATLQDFPLTSLTVLLLASVYAFLSLRLGLTLETIASIVALAVITHATYDLAREYLERLRIRNESNFRKQLRQLDRDDPAEDIVGVHLQEGLDLLCRTLNTTGGLIAVRQGSEFVVTNTKHSLPVESRISATFVPSDDVCQSEHIPSLAWIAPSVEGKTQVAIVGIRRPKTKIEYSVGDLDLLAEVADQVGTIVSLSSLRPGQKDKILQLVTESHARVSEMISIAGDMTNKIQTNPDPEFIKIVEEGLRNLPDYIALGQSLLADSLSIQGESHIERGKQLHQLLVKSIESLKPAEKRPAEPLPRVWYNHAVLFDAYVEGVPNREIMARLYISEGTFNRTRRNALRGLARLLLEERKPVKTG